VRVLDLDRLAPADARELAARLPERAAPGADARAIADEAGGHPLFIDELVRHAALTSGEHQTAALRLDDALAARVDRLDPGARRVLEIACVLGAPTPQETVAHAAALEMGDFARAVALLRTANLVRTQGSRVSDGMEPYHDRVREAVVARIDPEVKRLCHDSIASALEVSKAFDPEVLATHWTGAGKPARAATYTIVAAEQASGALAFDRAARLYERAIALLAEGDPRRDALRRQLGDALANAGHGVRAAEEYERAATGAGALDAIDLRRRAAAQLLRAGESARGAEATSRVLAAVGMRYPPSTLEAVVTFFWYRLLLWLRGFGYVLRDESQLSPEALIRVDVCGSAAETSLYADTLRGTLFHTRHLLLALRLGEPNRITRGLAQECSYLGASGSKKWARTQRVIEKAREVSERAGTPEARATVLGYAGAANCFNLRYSAAIEQIQQAIALYREIPGAIWEVTTLRFFLLAALHYSSRNLEHRAEQEAALKDALARGDRYATRMLRIGVLNRIWLLAGDPVRARHELDEAVREGAGSASAYGLTNLHQLVGYAYVDLYEGNGRAAHARVTKEWPLLRRSFLLLLEPLALEAGTLRARTALGAASAPDCPDRAALVHEAERALRGFKVMDTPTSRWALRSIHVGIAALKGHKDDVTRTLGHLATDDAEEAWIAKQGARWVLGAMRGSIEGEAQVRDAKKALELRGIVPDARLLGVLFPGLDLAAAPR
jgi:tetratricopeptide (TPR) repeat protein